KGKIKRNPKRGADAIRAAGDKESDSCRRASLTTLEERCRATEHHEAAADSPPRKPGTWSLLAQRKTPTAARYLSLTASAAISDAAMNFRRKRKTRNAFAAAIVNTKRRDSHESRIRSGAAVC